MRRKIAALLVPLLGLLTVDAAFAAKKAANAPLLKLFETSWQEDLADDPIAASAIGDHHYDDKLTDMSVEALAHRNQRAYMRLAALRKINREKLDKPDQLNYDLFERDIKNRIDEAQFKPYSYATRTFDGPQLLPQLTEILPFQTAKDYDNWIARLNGTGIYIDQWIVLLGQSALEHRTQPRVTIAKVLEQIKPQLVSDPETSPFYAPFKKFPASIDAATQARLTAAGKLAVQTVAVPAFQRFDKFFREVYLPASRDSVGISDTPDGDLFYRNRIKYYTTIDNMTATQIHNLGLEEVKRIRGEMEKALEPINFLGTVDQFLNELRVNPRFYFKTSEELMAAYEKTARGIEPLLPKLFGRLPKTTFDIRPIPAASAPTTTTAYYQPPSLDGTRKGTFYVNLYKPETRPMWEIDALTAHEAVPGHHLQVSLAYELQGLPEFRRNADYTAFVEGWALYSEGLGSELGLYKDDFSKFGQLNYDMWRAVRLVVDTGMHQFHWTREQAIYYFRTNTGKNLQDIENEVDRYISWPGQALAYKLGQLRIQALRAEAEKALGTRFDIRAFHDQLLGMGALPLSVLEVQMREWIAATSARR
ncbi:MAG TPA: DUF885 domain-containing protein [Steroidobacteraceae bacterium]|jgi:uncharacterized protein (DUF885 family)|nr:DUF885 domain-containing protein [Steroidobacteraceae bacterium]